MKDNVIIITGPTASGKSDVAKNIAHLFGGEIISADSQQIYKDMDIGTNKEKDISGIKHHMLDIIYPDEDFSVEDFSKKVRKLIREINERGNTPIIVGGTGFYIDSILFEMNYGNAARDQKIRDKYIKIYEDKGARYLYDILKNLDIDTAKKYHPNELNRIIRALEIYDITGKLPSKQRSGEKTLNDNINPIIFFLNYKDRKKLYEKINNRVIKMLNEGLLEEFRKLLDKYDLTESSKSMSAIGYKEIFPFIKGETDIDHLIDSIQQNTRRYAKRQITWMKRYLDYDFTYEIIMDQINKNDASDIIASILKDVYEF